MTARRTAIGPAWLPIVLAAIALMGAIGRPARAQAERIREARLAEEAARAARDDARKAAAEQAARRQQAAVRVVAPAAIRIAPAVNFWPDEQFEQWVFQQDRSADGARRKFDTQLSLHIDDIDRLCQLDADQKRKLQLLGHGDIKRLFDRYDEIKHRFNLMNNDMQKLGEIQQDVMPFRTTMQAGLFNESSLLVKSLRHTLSDEQYARYQAAAQDRRAFRHRAQVELAVCMIEQAIPMRDEQRRKFIDLLAKESKPFNAAPPYEYYVMMERIGRIPEEKIKPLFSPMQWKVLQRQVNQYRGIVPNLRRNGWVVEEDDDAEARAKD